MDDKLDEVKLPGVDKDFDAKPTGVEVDTGAYGETYDDYDNSGVRNSRK